MRLGLGLGLPPGPRSRPAISGTTPDGVVFDGFETPPTVAVINDEIVIRGKVKPGHYGKFVYPIEELQANFAYNVNVVADLTRLKLQGKKAAVGFGFKTDNSFHLVGLKGDGASGTDAFIVHGSPPNGWNKQTGHTEVNGGDAANGTQSACDIQLVTNEAGTAYTFNTSGDDQETWDEEFADQALTPFSDINAAEQFGIAMWFDATDTGEFTITITWTSEEASEPVLPGHRFWQVNITANDGDTHLSASEVKFATSHGGANICRGTGVAGTASASGEFSGDWSPSNAFDLNNSTSWVSANGTTSGWIQWQSTGGDLDVRHLVLISQNASGEESRSPKDFTLQYSDDGSSWQTALTKTGETGWGLKEARSYALPASVGAHEYWRLDITAVDGGSLIELAEMVLITREGLEITVEKAVVTATSEFDTTHRAQQLIDGSTANGWTNNGGATGVVKFDFGQNYELTEMKWTSRNGEGARSPKNFTIEHSDDGSTWTVAKTVTNETGWGSLEERTFQW